MNPQQADNQPQQPWSPNPQPETTPQLQNTAPSPVLTPAPVPLPSQPIQPALNQPTYSTAPQPAPINPYTNSYQQPTPRKSKKILLIAAIILVVAGLAVFMLLGGIKQITNTLSGLELESYSNKNFSFSIQIPKGWAPEETNTQYTKDVRFQEPIGDIKDTSEANKHYATLRISYELADRSYLEQTEKEYFDSIKKGLQQLINQKSKTSDNDPSSDYASETATIESEETTTVHGLKAYKITLKITNFSNSRDSTGYEYGLFVFIDNKHQYEVNLRAHESEAGINNKANEILNSFTRT